MKIVLEHGPNVDIRDGGYWENPKDKRHTEKHVNNLQDASIIFRSWINHNGLGAGNMTRNSGKVFDGFKCIGRISYNGRTWEE